ncbi:NAD+ synthetase [Texas Phoenix palm phytoplasma]|uniref:Glutamine-dependent NAD(+) synthetase n=1 Tax=Texas Phoenix palm phytoplasma TaxID=176709 RepID=A0ABS5BIW4_9MOLU|nr:nitrilase-related carbon-nitrogen hydrolase [Texas Phoenix palm phytoplasma]MBP3059523.1 NAD+ synthetase [Texas Phoenix palm phytoplasma]
MYRNGFLKIELSNPDLKVGNPYKNAQSIIKVLNKSESSFVLFSELCLSGYSSGDLFFDTTFLEENLKSLNYIINNNNFKGVYLIGMPFFLEGLILNVAVVIQDKKILGIVPKQTIPNYKEFNEKRWFSSGKIIKSQIIDFLGQKVPIGDILFINKKFDIIFGVEICQDLWNIESPSDLLVLNGAHLIFNLSASTEHIGKVNFRKMAVLNHSRKQVGGYFYTSSGITESITNHIFSSHKIAAVLGNLIGEKNLFDEEKKLIVDVFVDVIKFQRRVDTTFADQKIGKEFNFLKSYYELEEVKNYYFEKPFLTKPFVETPELKENLKLSHIIQVKSLKTKISNIKNSKIVLKLTDRINEFLTLMVVVQSFAMNKESLDNIIVIIEKKYFAEEELFFLIKEFVTELGIKTIINENLFLNKDKEIKCKKIVLESDNLSEIALGKISPKYCNYDYLYNVNLGLPNTLMTELIIFYFEEKIIPINSKLKEIYLKKINEFLTLKILIEDFILFHRLNNNFSKEKIAYLINKTFMLTFEQSLELTEKYIKKFYNSHYKRQQMAPGPKIIENSISFRTELQLPIDFVN